MKKGIMKVSVLLVAVIIMTGITAVSFAGDSDGNQVKTIKVARFSAGDYFKVGKSGNVTGYDPEYLDKISQYSKLKFEFVNCGTWENALEKLKNREVDLVGTMQRSSEREKEYEICTNSYGTTYATIATLKDSKYVYEDYDAMGKAAIGCVSGYVREPEMNDLFRKKGIAPDIKYYKNYPELEKAFKSGKVDMIAVNSHTLDTDYKIIEKYAY
ncbi:MAG: transporter substrate-binding domain-containing protein [Eubacteriaceae bacterium]|nr:transporter substrate-binding domain-containing protein [Eubacteriaceae bacterium]